jgi:hypothetical protein
MLRLTVDVLSATDLDPAGQRPPCTHALVKLYRSTSSVPLEATKTGTADGFNPVWPPSAASQISFRWDLATVEELVLKIELWNMDEYIGEVKLGWGNGELAFGAACEGYRPLRHSRGGGGARLQLRWHVVDDGCSSLQEPPGTTAPGSSGDHGARCSWMRGGSSIGAANSDDRI